MLTHSNHLSTHLDGEIHFYTPGKDIASLELNEFLVGPPAVIDLSDATGYHHFGWDQPYTDEIRTMVQHPGPDREFAEWCEAKKIKWIGVDCGSADHPMLALARKHK